ncbi:unnamed protein product [Gongylonema pulchrum]|uniref:Peptidase M12B domain-containing protein n=1 Tax=Gongylonema pulchrum TaxID=637853 RepID=A0A183CUW0_9BILA|nr:unnamed protein product [Gongylonema pulchrum]
MGGIFFHEVAHLIGVPHHNSAGCLKIPGYDHDCTLQQMVNMLEKNRCLRHTKKPSFFTSITDENSLPLCGNGVIEGMEECDCGLDKLCYNWNCRAEECKQIVKTWQIYLSCCAAAMLVMVATVYYTYGCCHRCILLRCKLACCSIQHLQLLSTLKSTVYPKSGYLWHHRNARNYTESLRRAGNSYLGAAKHHLITAPHKVNQSWLLVFLFEFGIL